MLGICYGAQILVHHYGGKVLRSDTREYGRARLIHVDATDKLLKEVDKGTQVWMSHADTITKLPPDYTITGSTADVKAAAYHPELRISGEFSFTLKCTIQHRVQKY